MPKRSVKDSAIIAPGGGTKEDVSNLARDLGMDQDAVLAVLHSQGAGVRVSRSSAAAAHPGLTSNTPAMSSAWADFMNEQGVVPISSANAETTTKRAKTSPTKTNNVVVVAAAAAVSSVKTDNKSRSYHLPIDPRMKIQSLKTKTGKSNNEENDDNGGILAQTGTLDATLVGRKKGAFSNRVQDLVEPTIVGYSSIFSKIPIALIATSSSACHSLAIDIHGDAYAWGRNEAGQCGNTLGNLTPCVAMPTRIQWGEDEKFMGAAVGKSHSILISTRGHVYAVGSNKYGQCGVSSTVESVTNWKRCVFAKISVPGEEGAKAVSNERGSIQVVQVMFFFFLLSHSLFV